MSYILVVDDFEDGREMVAAYLELRGLTVRQASTADEALGMARATPPAIVLMDMSMPGLDGWQATRLLRADPSTQHTVVIALTARAMPAEVQRAIDCGCDEVLTKPFELEVLGAVLDRVLRSSRSVPETSEVELPNKAGA